MERTISATDANREFSRVLNEVANGATYVVTSRGKPTIKMVPVTTDEADLADRKRKMKALVDRLGQLPARNLGRVTRDDGYE